MLELLPTRGPDAFQKFLRIIEPEYHWLAEKLKNELEKEVSKIPKKKMPMKEMPMTSNSHSELVPSTTLNSDQAELISVSLAEQATPKDIPDSAIPGSNLVKKEINNFMAQQFSLSQKLCQSDKQAIESFIIGQIQEVQRQCHQKFCEGRDHRRLNDEIQNWLQKTCRKLERSLGHTNHFDTMKEGFKDSKKTIKAVEDSIHKLSEHHLELEHEVKKCMSLFGENHEKFSLAFLVERAIADKKEMTEEKNKLEQGYQLMVSKNIDLTVAKQKEQDTSANKDVGLEVKDRQIKSLQLEIQRLNKLHVQHLEKEKTLTNLKQIVQNITEENVDLKNKIQEDHKHFPTRRPTGTAQRTPRSNNPKHKSLAKKKTRN